MHRHAVRVIISNSKGEYLLAQSARSGNWKFVGGGIEEGEEEMATAVRELHEELGIKVKPTDLEPLGQLQEIISEDNPDIAHDLQLGHVQEVAYFALTTDSKVSAGGEIADIVWVKKAEVLDKLRYVTQKEAFSKLILKKEFVSTKQWTVEK